MSIELPNQKPLPLATKSKISVTENGRRESPTPKIELPSLTSEPLAVKTTAIEDRSAEDQTQPSIFPPMSPALEAVDFATHDREFNSPTQQLTMGDEPEPEEPESKSLVDMNFSEIKHQTDLQIKRLGWTREDGRNFLQTRYGKRSRLHLDDEQLLEFLRYLESLPDPS